MDKRYSLYMKAEDGSKIRNTKNTLYDKLNKINKTIMKMLKLDSSL